MSSSLIVKQLKSSSHSSLLTQHLDIVLLARQLSLEIYQCTYLLSEFLTFKEVPLTWSVCYLTWAITVFHSDTVLQVNILETSWPWMLICFICVSGGIHGDISWLPCLYVASCRFNSVSTQ